MADHETHADALAVDLCGAQELAELMKELVHLLLFYALACIYYVDKEHLSLIIEGSDDSNTAISRELECVLDQIDQDLLEPKCITT